MEGTTAVAVPIGTKCIHGPTVRDFQTSAHARRTSGNLTLNSTSWANLDTGLDLVLPAYAGDVVEVGLTARWNNESVFVGLDAVSLVSGSPVVTWSQNAAEGALALGVGGWEGWNGYGSVGGSVLKLIAATDLTSGVLTIRFRYRTNTAANKLLYASTDPLNVFAINHGPQYVAPTF